MRVFSANILCASILLLSSVDAFPPNHLSTTRDLSKRAWTFDNANHKPANTKKCTDKYGKLTAEKWIDNSLAMVPDLATAGRDGIEKIMKVLENQAGVVTPQQKTGVKKGEWEKLMPLYRVLFGDLRKEDPDTKEENPNFKAEALEHIARIKIIKDSLNRLSKYSKTNRPNLSIHCSDDWLLETKADVDKPDRPLKPGHKWLYDTDKNQWKQYDGGKPCQGQRAAVTFTGKLGSTKAEP